ncbi:MAG: surface lipoprotein assembly modifier [Rhodobacteraceae bacterium]|nr:surface lipoprotein assembly modifier [Paracoccaceae bacterium]
MWFRARLWMRAAAFAAVFCAAQAPADPVELSPGQMRAAAVGALDRSDPQRALRYADALTARDPADRTAHLVRARALRDMGRTAQARKAAGNAWALAQTPEQKYAGAMVMAQVLSTAGHRTRAQLWLRRAVQNAPDDALAARARRDFRYVRSRNPWATRFSFSVLPQSNINNGSSERTSYLNYDLSRVIYGEPVAYQLGGTARALSGVEYALGLDTRYRFAQTPTRAHDLTLSFDTRHYTLSAEAKRIAPAARGSDFAFTSYALGYQHRGLLRDGRAEYTLGFDLGQSWYGGDPYARFMRGAVSHAQALAPHLRLFGRLSAERQFGQNTADTDTLRADFSVTRKLVNGIEMNLGLGAALTASPVADAEFTELGLSARLALPDPVMGAHVTMGLGLRNRDHDTTRHGPDGRSDTRLSADLTLTFRDIDYYGFNPTMTVTAAQTQSNIGLYTADRLGVNFGIQSAF